MDFSLFNVTLQKTLNEVMKINRLLSLLLFLCLSLQLSFSATDNPEAPNLNFSHDNFDGWKRYYGEFYAVDQSGVAYEYKWTEQSNTGERIKIINTVDEQDPIVACSNLYTNPFDGSLVARIGEPLKTEGMTDSSKPCPDRWQKQRPAAAEKLSYTYIVGPNSNILNYNFATVLQIPVKSGSPHFGDEFPYFGIQIEVKNPTTGAYYQVPCGAYNTIANETSHTLLSNLTYDKCPASSA
jgi:hypothetical protein